jgi:hypothetical protein
VVAAAATTVSAPNVIAAKKTKIRWRRGALRSPYLL